MIKLILKIFLAALVMVLGVASITYLQGRFDNSDLNHALQAVQQNHPQGPEGPSLVELIEKRFGTPARQILWRPRLESKFKGLVVVEAYYDPQQKPLEWEVDLVRFVVSPRTKEAKALVGQ